MSLSKERRTKLPTLTGADGHAAWTSSLQDFMFKKFRNVNVSALREHDTLDSAYYKNHKDFKADFKRASKEAEDGECNPFVNDKDYAGKCFQHSLASGEGFADWLPGLFADIRDSLSATIHAQTSGVSLGDVVALLSSVKLAVHEHEVFDADELDILFTSLKMEDEARNDLMTFFALFARYVRRLKAVSREPDEQRKIRVMLRGINQDIFQNLIDGHERAPFETSAKLQRAIEAQAAKPRYAAQLRAIVPGKQHSISTTRTRPGIMSPTSAKFSALESKLESILAMREHGGNGKENNSGGRSKGSNIKLPCYSWRDTGKCGRGDKCRFAHVSSSSSNKDSTSIKIKSVCLYHGAGGHDTDSCSLLKKNHQLKATLKAGIAAEARNGSTAGHQVHATTNDADQGYSFICALRTATVPARSVSDSQHVFSARALPSAPKIDMWCVDGAATSMATWDESRGASTSSLATSGYLGAIQKSKATKCSAKKSETAMSPLTTRRRARLRRCC